MRLEDRGTRRSFNPNQVVALNNDSDGLLNHKQSSIPGLPKSGCTKSIRSSPGFTCAFLQGSRAQALHATLTRVEGI